MSMDYGTPVLTFLFYFQMFRKGRLFLYPNERRIFKAIYIGSKREFSKLIGLLVIALIAVGLVFNVGGVKDVLLELFDRIIGA